MNYKLIKSEQEIFREDLNRENAQKRVSQLLETSTPCQGIGKAIEELKSANAEGLAAKEFDFRVEKTLQQLKKG